jgi:23S rRNA pseudouridine2605 synthase
MRNSRPGQPRPAGDKTHGRPLFRHKGRKPRPGKVEEAPAIAETMRIAKAMARAGLCSRRDAERWVLEGRVSVNGEVLKSPARDVGPADTVKVDGQPLVRPEPAMLWRFHKPRGCVTTHKDPEGRPTVFEKLPKEMPRVVSIGRLDFNTEGLLLLTTDGGLARHFELPATGWLRRYRVRANGTVTQEQLDALKDGITIDGVSYGPVEGTVDRVQGANVWLTLGLREGKNREVRKILGSLGLEVNRLIRISFGPFQLLDLAEGTVERVKRRVLADQLGPTLAHQFGLDVIQPDERPAKNTGYVARKPLPDEDAPKQPAGPRKPFGQKKAFAKHGQPREDGENRTPRGQHLERTTKGERFTAKPTGFGSRVLRADTGGPRKPYGDKARGRDSGEALPGASRGRREDRPPGRPSAPTRGRPPGRRPK